MRRWRMIIEARRERRFIRSWTSCVVLGERTRKKRREKDDEEKKKKKEKETKRKKVNSLVTVCKVFRSKTRDDTQTHTHTYSSLSLSL